MILIPALLALLAGWGVSYAFSPRYTSRALILVENQTVPEDMVQPVVSGDLSTRIQTLQTEVLSHSELVPVVQRLRLSETPDDVDAAIDNIRQNVAFEPVPDLFEIGGIKKKKKAGQGGPVPGFYLNYTDSNPRRAQDICTELTSSMIRDYGRAIDQAASGTRDVLSRALEDAKDHLLDLGLKLAGLKKQLGRESGSPEIEEQYKVLSIEYENAEKTYRDLLADKSKADLTLKMILQQQGERMVQLYAASKPDDPDFPNRLLFAGAGLGTGIVTGLGLALWGKLRSNAIRPEGETVNLP